MSEKRSVPFQFSGSVFYMQFSSLPSFPHAPPILSSFYLFIIIIFGEEYRWWSSSLCKLLLLLVHTMSSYFCEHSVLMRIFLNLQYYLSNKTAHAFLNHVFLLLFLYSVPLAVSSWNLQIPANFSLPCVMLTHFICLCNLLRGPESFLRSWERVQLAKKFPLFVELECSLSCHKSRPLVFVCLPITFNI
jgi:hypothetical protein